MNDKENIKHEWVEIRIPAPDMWPMKKMLETGYRESTKRHKETRIGWSGKKEEKPTEEEILYQPVKKVKKGKYAGRYYIFRPNGKYINGIHRLDRIYLMEEGENDI